MEWVEVAIKVKREAQEAVTALLERLGLGGCSIEDPLLWEKKAQEEGWDYVEEAPPVSAGMVEAVVVKGYLSQDQRLPGRLDAIRQFLRDLPSWGLDPGPGEVSLQFLAEEDWAEAWKAYYHAVEIGQRLVVKPSWEEYTGKDRLVIDLDPGMAFGTGTHPTTVLCLEALGRLIQGGEEVWDLGTGSGILAIAAARLGAGRVRGFDVDPTAVAVARNNVLRNGVVDLVTIEELDVLEEPNPLPAAKAHVIVANIIAEVLIRLAPRLPYWLSPGGRAVLGGIIQKKALRVQEALAQGGLHVEERAEREGWVCLVARKEAGQ